MAGRDIDFDELYKRYKHRFVLFANSYIKDPVAAENIVVDAFIYYWENRARMSDESDVPAYVLTVVKNKCLNYLRHLEVGEDYAKEVKEYYQWDLNTRISTLEACEPHELFSAEIKRLVDEALENMPEKTRIIFCMNRIDGKSYKEISEEMGLSVKGVDFHICKALKILRIKLKDYFPIFLFFY